MRHDAWRPSRRDILKLGMAAGVAGLTGLAGCDLLVSQCSPGTASQRNQLRAGFAIAGTKVWWVPIADG